ncbi:hypothetical protein ATANTOWER_026287, partial [Ataeniobius toweri]|nr:hypothetical protein [Ataeniobius toweri]
NIWTDQNLLLDPDLPSGWRTIKDSTGTYYWHVPTGTTQWQHPCLTGKPKPLETQQEEAEEQSSSKETEGATEECARYLDIQRPPRAQEPQENHHRDYHNPPREEQGRAPGEPPSSHSVKAPGSFSDEPTGPPAADYARGRSSHGPRDLRPRDTSLSKQRPNRAQGSRPRQAATGSETAHTENHKYTSRQRNQPHSVAGSVGGRE